MAPRRQGPAQGKEEPRGCRRGPARLRPSRGTPEGQTIVKGRPCACLRHLSGPAPGSPTRRDRAQPGAQGGRRRAGLTGSLRRRRARAPGPVDYLARLE